MKLYKCTEIYFRKITIGQTKCYFAEKSVCNKSGLLTLL